MAAAGRLAGAAGAARSLLDRAGLSVRRRSSTLPGARRQLLASGQVALVVDVGAHLGEYVRVIRGEGYGGAIVSFEPIAAHFRQLQTAAADDEGWSGRNAAVGAEPGTATINVSGNEGFSSSLLEMDEAHVRAVEASAFERTEEVEMVTLDGELGEDGRLQGGGYLKVDAQGFEAPALRGAEQVLRHCVAVELELSLRTLYEGQLLIGEMIELVRDHGFAPTHLEPEFIDPSSGELLQVNGLFRRL
ncbi:MAG: FkbM family methyltransferase [Solirubrobacterales bacterium]